MSKNSRPKRARKKKKRRSRNQVSGNPFEKPLTRAQLAIALTVVFAAVAALIYNTQPIDRSAALVLWVVCAGFAFVITGAFMAVPLAMQSVQEQAHARLGSHRGRGGQQTSPSAKFDSVFVPLAFVCGVVHALISPKRTWPAVAWVGSGMLMILVTILGLMILSTF